MVKAIIFDLKGVIFTTKFWSLMKELLESKDEDIEDYWGAVRASWRKARIGKITSGEFYEEASEKTGLSKEEIKYCLLSKIEINDDIKNLIVNLNKKYKIGILTNTIQDLYEGYLKIWDFEGIAKVVASFREKVKKPDQEAMKLIIKKLGVNKNEVIYIDDRKSTIDKYSNSGIRCIHFNIKSQESSTLNKELKRLGILI